MALTMEERSFIYNQFLASDKPSLIFRALFERKKQTHPHFSIAQLCKSCGIPSRGYLSEFLNGKRRLNSRYWKGFIKCFGLTGRLATAAHVVFELEDADSEDERRVLMEKLESLRRSFKKVEESFPSRLHGMVFAAEVYCAFGLYGNNPTKEQLKSYFGRSRALDVEYALACLMGIEVIGLDTDTQRYFIRENTIRFTDSEDSGLTMNSFHQYAVQDAERAFKKWYSSQDAYFETIMISVKKSRLPEFIEKVKDHSILTAQEVESTEADMLIRFNVQIYPLH
ncbi:TIGR02147 family protein [Oligoflexus tunisiensis]|uniref:TIGR02147 family protein n=1 Tax=Oligoflexus tunisiensis TaxID=708132 RepID=UPI00114C87E6|nr:TIGR02147 family protein [Oligoflexus tunisiensis]